MTVIIIEDDRDFALNVAKKVRKAWYKTEVFNSIKEFKDSKILKPSLYVIDIWLWDWNWFELVKWLRLEKKSTTPILIMSCYDSVRDKVLWLDIWADDYLPKPFSPDELLARIRSLLRRPGWLINNTILTHRDIKLNLVTKDVFLWTDKIHLPHKEKQILEIFLTNKWEIISKWRLIDWVWPDYELIWVSDNTINATLSKLKKKLWWSFILETKINEGYILK